MQCCEFSEQHDSMIRDRIVFGVSDSRLKERLLRESSELTLEKGISLCSAAEAGANQLKQLQISERKPVEVVKQKVNRGLRTQRVHRSRSIARNVETSICRNRVEHLEGIIVTFVKESIITPKCIHKEFSCTHRDTERRWRRW